jgi:predicted dehydrogenase
MKGTNVTRRDFLRTSAAAAAVALPCLVPSRVLGRGGRPGANETVRIGVIGCGGRARTLVNEAKGVKGFRVAAACDCFRPRLVPYLKETAADLPTYEDFRAMIEKEKLDAVMVETTTHARAWVAVLAMQAGMDVYIEKPMCLSIAEGRAMVKAARKYHRVTQVGTQQRSMPINNWASDLVRGGAIGKVHTVLASNFIGTENWTDQPGEAMPAGGSANWWDIWTNQAPLRPYHSRLHWEWPRYWDYDGGGYSFGVTGFGTHAYDQINRALGTDDTGPVEVVLDEPVAVSNTGRFAPRNTVGTAGRVESGAAKPVDDWGAVKLSGPRAKVTMRFAGGTRLKLHLDGDRGPGLGAIFIGERGKIEIGRNKLASNPKELVRSPDNPGPNRRPESAYHVENWIECIKSRQPCNADIEIGQRATTLCLLVNVARQVGQVGKPLRWDPAAERFTNSDEANRLLSRERRKGYELPEV